MFSCTILRFFSCKQIFFILLHCLHFKTFFSYNENLIEIYIDMERLRETFSFKQIIWDIILLHDEAFIVFFFEKSHCREKVFFSDSFDVFMQIRRQFEQYGARNIYFEWRNTFYVYTCMLSIHNRRVPSQNSLSDENYWGTISHSIAFLI